MDGRFEILLPRRPDAMGLLGGFYVLPGGSIEAQDRAENVLSRCRGISGPEAEKILGDHRGPDLSLAHWVAGIRELFEEVGVLLSVTDDGAAPASDGASAARFEEKRRAPGAGALDFGAFLEAEKLFLDFTRAVYFSPPLTPEVFPV